MKFGIAGAGSIVPNFLLSQKNVEGITPWAICASTRSKERMEGFQAEYGIRNIYFSYDDMLTDPDLEAIYVAVPNHLHYEFAKKALQRGLHVICEKPFCTKKEELAELIALSKEKKLFLFEAITNQYLPNFEKAKELLPGLGQVRIVTLNYSQYSSRYDRFLQGDIAPVFDPEKNGGALMDLNVYNIHYVTGLFGRPERVQYNPNVQRGVDTSGVLVLTYPGFVCTLVAAKDCKAPQCVNVQGEKGCLVSESNAGRYTEFSLQMNDGALTHFELNGDVPDLYHELKFWENITAAGDYEACAERLSHSMIVQEILEEAATAVRR